MKTPEQMALEYIKDVETARNPSVTATAFPQMQRCFLAGYQAAINSPEKPDSCEHILDMEKMVDVDKVMFCVYCNDTHKGNCAIGKGKNHPTFGFSEIVVKIESSWVSVKERLPPPETEVLWWNKTAHQAGVSSWEYMSHCNDTMLYWGDAGNVSIKNFTHWMPLPEPPVA